jgi:hypothetical protein
MADRHESRVFLSVVFSRPRCCLGGCFVGSILTANLSASVSILLVDRLVDRHVGLLQLEFRNGFDTVHSVERRQIVCTPEKSIFYCGLNSERKYRGQNRIPHVVVSGHRYGNYVTKVEVRLLCLPWFRKGTFFPGTSGLCACLPDRMRLLAQASLLQRLLRK